MAQLNDLIPSLSFPEFKGVPCRLCGVEVRGIKLGELCYSCGVKECARLDELARREYAASPAGQLALGIPEQYFGARFSDFPEQHDALASWCRTPRKPLLLWGGCGAGKTRALYAIRRNCFINRVPVTGGPCGEVIRGGLAAASARASHGYLRQIIRHRGVVILDDLGAAAMSDYAAGTLAEIISIREEHSRAIAIASNLDIAALCKLLGERTASRLAGGVILAFKSNDRRMNRAA